jgi:4-hydroxy-tetrahydrodipicolinate reductase
MRRARLAGGGARVIELVLVGAAGRMGRAVAEAARASDEFVIRGGIERAGVSAGADSGAAGGAWTSDAASMIRRGDVVIEFSSAAACAGIAALCAERGAALVSGSTGLTPADEAAVREAARRTPVLRAANFSLGLAALRAALEAAIDALPGTWDIEIIERHHHHKTDSPSGTALSLAHHVLEKRKLGVGALRHGREGQVGARSAGEIGMHAVRGGTWAGDHTVLLAGEGEWIELRHVVQDRSAFASGALAAARFVSRAGPGFYNLKDVLGTP